MIRERENKIICEIGEICAREKKVCVDVCVCVKKSYLCIMKPWRDILALCVSVVVMLTVASCGGNSDRPGLVALDSLILPDPDSACELLAAYPPDSLLTADDRAYHALLTTIADYKAYRPATSDSVINIAVNHYDHNGANQDKRMRSLLYKGCVMEVIGNLKGAMGCYKEAQYACPDNDNFHKGYIHFRIGALFQSVAEVEQAVYYYKKAINAFIQVQEKYYYINCLNIKSALVLIGLSLVSIVLGYYIFYVIYYPHQSQRI